MHSNKSLIFFLLLLWTGFMAWELNLQNTINNVQYPMVRYDLLVLPLLVLFTGYAVYILIRKKATNKL